MSKQKKKTMKNTPKTMRGEKVKDASKLSSQSPQIGNKMKQKYIQRLKDSPKSKEERAGQTTEQTDTQAIEQVQNSGQWAAAELAGTTGRMVRQGREYAKKKAKAAKQDTPVSPADDPPEQPACTPPEVMPPKELDPAPLTHQFPPQKAPSPMENSIPGQAPPATAPKELRPKKRPIPANAPKERQPGGHEPIPCLEKEPSATP